MALLDDFVKGLKETSESDSVARGLNYIAIALGLLAVEVRELVLSRLPSVEEIARIGAKPPPNKRRPSGAPSHSRHRTQR